MSRATKTLVCLLVVRTLVVSSAANFDKTLDLTVIPRSERHSLGVPGFSVGGTSNGHLIGPALYNLPLTAKIKETQVHDQEILHVGIEVQNTETRPFQLPSCVDEGKAHRANQLDRRTFKFLFEFSDNDLRAPIKTTADVTFGAATVPECSITIGPGGSVLVVPDTEIPREIRRPSARSSQVQLRALLEELTLENNRFQVGSISQEVRSDLVPVPL